MLRPALAVLSGLLLAAAFPRFYLGLVSAIGLLPLLVAIHLPGTPRSGAVSPGRAFRLGYLTGVVFFLGLLHWIPRLPQENVTIPFVMFPALGLMAAYLGIYPGLVAMIGAWATRRGVPLGFVVPPLWVLFEVVRGTGTFGFPWGVLGYAMADNPHLIQFASLTGVWGVSLWLALLGGLVHAYLDLRWVWPKMLALAGLSLLVTVPYLHGRHVLASREPRAAVRVGVVQPNVGKEKWAHGVRDSVVTALVEHHLELAESQFTRLPDLVIWPETAVPAILPRELRYLEQITAAVDSSGVPVLAGYPDGHPLEDGGWFITNAAGLLVPGQGIVDQYEKRHLVPFSEYFPVPFLNRVDFGQSNFTPGEEPGVFNQLRVPFGVLICFESIFPGPARELSLGGARYLVNITNDQWFGDSAAPDQHFKMNVLRVIETGMGMARAANTGISAILDPYGFPMNRTATFVPARFVGAVEVGTGPTFYVRHGDWIVWLSLVWASLLVGTAWIRGRRA